LTYSQSRLASALSMNEQYCPPMPATDLVSHPRTSPVARYSRWPDSWYYCFVVPSASFKTFLPPLQRRREGANISSGYKKCRPRAGIPFMSLLKSDAVLLQVETSCNEVFNLTRSHPAVTVTAVTVRYNQALQALHARTL
jgi:hypothetical protein